MAKKADASSHSGSAPKDLLWVLINDEGTVTREEYRRRLKAAKKNA